jgi:hypothetical protein
MSPVTGSVLARVWLVISGEIRQDNYRARALWCCSQRDPNLSEFDSARYGEADTVVSPKFSGPGQTLFKLVKSRLLVE